MPETPTNPQFAKFAVALFTGLGTVIRRSLTALAGAAVAHGIISSQFELALVEFGFAAAIAVLEFVLFRWQIAHGKTIQQIINDYAGSRVITEDGIVGPETTAAVITAFLPANQKATQLDASIENAGKRTLPLLLAALMLTNLTGCASLQQWAVTHEAQLKQTGEVLVTVAARAAINAAASKADAEFKSDILRAMASELRSQSKYVVTSDDILKVLKIWQPNDGEVWERLTSKVAAIAAEELAAQGKSKAADVAAAIADGLDKAAAATATVVEAE